MGEFERSREGMAGRKCREKEGVLEEWTSMAGEEREDGNGAVHDTYLLRFPACKVNHTRMSRDDSGEKSVSLSQDPRGLVSLLSSRLYDAFWTRRPVDPGHLAAVRARALCLRDCVGDLLPAFLPRERSLKSASWPGEKM